LPTYLRATISGIIPGNGFLYICPQLIVHYMNAHGYLPPDDFCNAVLDCPEMRSVEYMKSVLANGGRKLLSEIGNFRAIEKDVENDHTTGR
jgi:hypothetical protein